MKRSEAVSPYGIAYSFSLMLDALQQMRYVSQSEQMTKRIIDDTDSIYERLKKIKEEEVEAQKPIGTCQECQTKKIPCTGACYCFCDPYSDVDYSCGGPIVYEFQDSI